LDKGQIFNGITDQSSHVDELIKAVRSGEMSINRAIVEIVAITQE
jgi:hypothetical protein